STLYLSQNPKHEAREPLPAARLAVPTPLIWHSAHSICPRHSLAMTVPVISSIARLTSRRLYRSVRGWHAAPTSNSFNLSYSPYTLSSTFFGNDCSRNFVNCSTNESKTLPIGSRLARSSDNCCDNVSCSCNSAFDIFTRRSIFTVKRCV